MSDRISKGAVSQSKRNNAIGLLLCLPTRAAGSRSRPRRDTQGNAARAALLRVAVTPPQWSSPESGTYYRKELIRLPPFTQFPDTPGRHRTAARAGATMASRRSVRAGPNEGAQQNKRGLFGGMESVGNETPTYPRPSTRHRSPNPSPFIALEADTPTFLRRESDGQLFEVRTK